MMISKPIHTVESRGLLFIGSGAFIGMGITEAFQMQVAGAVIGCLLGAAYWVSQEVSHGTMFKNRMCNNLV